MVRGTTPTVKINIDGCDVTLLSKMFITLKQRNVEIEKTIEDITILESNKVSFTLSQEETLLLNAGLVDMQFRGVDSSGVAVASEIFSSTISDILKEGVI